MGNNNPDSDLKVRVDQDLMPFSEGDNRINAEPHSVDGIPIIPNVRLWAVDANIGKIAPQFKQQLSLQIVRNLDVQFAAELQLRIH